MNRGSVEGKENGELSDVHTVNTERIGEHSCARAESASLAAENPSTTQVHAKIQSAAEKLKELSLCMHYSRLFAHSTYYTIL